MTTRAGSEQGRYRSRGSKTHALRTVPTHVIHGRIWPRRPVTNTDMPCGPDIPYNTARGTLTALGKLLNLRPKVTTSDYLRPTALGGTPTSPQGAQQSPDREFPGPTRATANARTVKAEPLPDTSTVRRPTALGGTPALPYRAQTITSRDIAKPPSARDSI